MWRAGADDALVESIYAGIGGEASWRSFLDELAATVPDSKVTLAVHDDAEQKTYLVQRSASWTDSVAESYQAHFAEMDPLPGLLLQRPDERGYADGELTCIDEFNRTPYFNEFLLPNEMGSSAAIKLAQQGGRSLIVGISAPVGVVAQEDVPARLTCLGPHLRRAFSYYRKTSASLAITGPDSSLLRSMDVGLMVLQEGGRVASISEPMQNMLRATKLIGTSPQGRIRFRNEEMQFTLANLLRKRNPGPEASTFREGDFEVTLVRLKKDALLNEFEGPTVAVMMQSVRANQPSVALDEFTREHGLTKAEQRALAGIVAGKTVDAIATEAFVSRETVRSQIKRLYAKTGANSMADVIRLALLPRNADRHATQ